MIFFDHQLADKFVELNRINLCERLNQEHPNLLDHIEMLFKKKQIPFDFRLSFNFLYLLRQMHRLYDLWHIPDRRERLHLNKFDLVSLPVMRKKNSFSLTNRIDMIHIIDEIPFSKRTCNLNKEELIDMEQTTPDQRSNCRFNYFGIGTTFLEHSKRERRRRKTKQITIHSRRKRSTHLNKIRIIFISPKGMITNSKFFFFLFQWWRE